MVSHLSLCATIPFISNDLGSSPQVVSSSPDYITVDFVLNASVLLLR